MEPISNIQKLPVQKKEPRDKPQALNTHTLSWKLAYRNCSNKLTAGVELNGVLC